MQHVTHQENNEGKQTSWWVFPMYKIVIGSIDNVYTLICASIFFIFYLFQVKYIYVIFVFIITLISFYSYSGFIYIPYNYYIDMNKICDSSINPNTRGDVIPSVTSYASNAQFIGFQNVQVWEFPYTKESIQRF